MRRGCSAVAGAGCGCSPYAPSCLRSPAAVDLLAKSFFPRGCRPRTPASLQGLPPPDPRYSPGAAAPGPPLLSQGLPPPDPHFFPGGCCPQTPLCAFEPPPLVATGRHPPPLGFPRLPRMPGDSGLKWRQVAPSGGGWRPVASVLGPRLYAYAPLSRRHLSPLVATRRHSVPSTVDET